MRAAEKMKAFGMKALAEKVSRLYGETHLVTLYRWHNALERGDGIRDVNKRKLVEATKGTVHAITWADFQPQPQPLTAEIAA